MFPERIPDVPKAVGRRSEVVEASPNCIAASVVSNYQIVDLKQQTASLVFDSESAKMELVP